jgi:hypothetical protein
LRHSRRSCRSSPRRRGVWARKSLCFTNGLVIRWSLGLLVPCSRGRGGVVQGVVLWKVGRVCAVAGTLRCGLRLPTITSVAWGSAHAHSPPHPPPRVSGVMHVSPWDAIGLYGRYCGFIGTEGGHSTRAKVSLHPHVATRHPTHSICAYKQSLACPCSACCGFCSLLWGEY